ncbi:dihydrolipoamide acetyltransferase family protein [Microbacterium sp. No. 7]|uniref:dihydrolipoamide acetyltransferase family protein n=1 Tax=Microbacterium sp. No. 7 TaxID=1714373 RepID=UPI0006D27650|nr:dihydrolipoamide acetyltransferase family protein [Microbacterium sp. No. 7]ALJ21750.1 branched-chain alpha-keto acid dehydrogenase subunit E2 [Microbacterium sp. No. 7]
MAEIIRMPEVLAGAAEAAVQTWLVSVGSVVAVDQPLAEIETDKAIVEFTAEKAGTIGRLLIAEGDTVAVGDPIVVLLGDGEGDDAIGPALAAAGVADAGVADTRGGGTGDVSVAAEPVVGVPAPAPSVDEEPAGAVSGGEEPAEAAPDSGRIFATPIVRRLAAQAGVPLADVAGTGPRARIVRRDLERHLAALERSGAASRASAEASSAEAGEPASAAASMPTPAAVPASASAAGAGFEDVPLDRMRKAIARRLTESKATVPHFYLVADCRVERLLELRRTVNETAARKISVNDFVLKAVAAALVEVPAANAIWNVDSIRRFSSVDVSVAVATEGGLTTPVLRGVERMPLGEVSATVADLAERARAGRLRQHELEGGSFSVSNLGMYGTAQFTAILNPPQSGILAVGAARAVPVVGVDGALEAGQVMTVTLSADHRVLDGAVAAEWLAAFQRRIENPLSILI